MITYKIVNISSFDEIENHYELLLENKYSFLVLVLNNDNYILTKERSFFKVENLSIFIGECEKDVYFKTIVKNEDEKNNIIYKSELILFRNIIDKFRNELEKKYANKYMFGTVAVRISQNAFITTIRGKHNLEDYTIVRDVDFDDYTITVINKKATLNAPLLAYLFKNNKVKYIVHLHTFDKNLPTYEYAIPGTERDSLRNNTTSFNIKNHGLIYLFDENNEIL